MGSQTGACFTGRGKAQGGEGRVSGAVEGVAGRSAQECEGHTSHDWEQRTMLPARTPWINTMT